MADTMVVSCPECDKSLRVPATAAGKKIRCKACEHIFLIEVPGAIKPAPGPARKPPAKPARPVQPVEPLDDDDDEENSNPYGVTDLEVGFRCPQCAEEMESPDSIICIACGYNTQTREQARMRKIKETTGGDKFLWLLPGILCVIGILCLLGYCAFHHFAMPGILIENWDELTKDKTRNEALADDSVEWWQAAIVHPAGELWLFVACLYVSFYLGKFAVKRLIQNPSPPEIEER